MFVLVEMVDTVRIPPWDFHKQLNEAIAEELNKKLANKVQISKLCKRFIAWNRLDLHQSRYIKRKKEKKKIQLVLI